MMPVFPSALARRMSAVVRTGVIRSVFSLNQHFHRAMFRIVSANPSQIEQVQFAAVNPPLRMSAKTARFHLEITRPSMTMSESCNPVIQVPAETRRTDAVLFYLKLMAAQAFSSRLRSFKTHQSVLSEIGGPQYRTQRALGSDRVPPDVLTVGRRHATKVLRPRAIDCRIQNHMTRTTGTQFLRLGRESEKRVDLALREQVERLELRVDNPSEIFFRIEPDLGRHQPQQRG